MRLFVKDVNDRVLRENILRMSRATGRTVKEETTTVLKGMVRDAIMFTQPASGNATGKAAQRQGEAAISRDLKLIGFVPIQIKGFRMVTHAFGHPITPVRVKTKENPAFAEPDLRHRERLRRSGGRLPSRGGHQAFYVSRSKFTSMANRLKKQVGRLASGWVNAAQQLGVPAPFWILRHGGGRGSQVQIVETAGKIRMRVVNHFPDTAGEEAAGIIRRIARLKEFAIGRMKRNLAFRLKNNIRAAKRN